MRVLTILTTGDADHGHRSTHTRRYTGSLRPQEGPLPEVRQTRPTERTCTRGVRTVAYKAIVFLEITYGEYGARCEGSTTFRNTPEGVLPKALYDNRVRDLVLDRILQDGMSIGRTLASLRREFLLDLSSGFV